MCYSCGVIYDASLDGLLQKVWDGKRINAAEALRLYNLPLEELGALAHRRSSIVKGEGFNDRGNDVVTYIVDRNVNYTNVCNVYCKFCAFYRTEKDSVPTSSRSLNWTKKSRKPLPWAARRCSCRAAIIPS